MSNKRQYENEPTTLPLVGDAKRYRTNQSPRELNSLIFNLCNATDITFITQSNNPYTMKFWVNTKQNNTFVVELYWCNSKSEQKTHVINSINQTFYTQDITTIIDNCVNTKFLSSSYKNVGYKGNNKSTEIFKISSSESIPYQRFFKIIQDNSKETITIKLINELMSLKDVEFIAVLLDVSELTSENMYSCTWVETTPTIATATATSIVESSNNTPNLEFLIFMIVNLVLTTLILSDETKVVVCNEYLDRCMYTNDDGSSNKEPFKFSVNCVTIPNTEVKDMSEQGEHIKEEGIDLDLKEARELNLAEITKVCTIVREKEKGYNALTPSNVLTLLVSILSVIITNKSIPLYIIRSIYELLERAFLPNVKEQTIVEYFAIIKKISQNNDINPNPNTELMYRLSFVEGVRQILNDKGCFLLFQEVSNSIDKVMDGKSWTKNELRIININLTKDYIDRFCPEPILVIGSNINFSPPGRNPVTPFNPNKIPQISLKNTVFDRSNNNMNAGSNTRRKINSDKLQSANKTRVKRM
jgi:hypothetical protein